MWSIMLSFFLLFILQSLSFYTSFRYWPHHIKKRGLPFYHEWSWNWYVLGRKCYKWSLYKIRRFKTIRAFQKSCEQDFPLILTSLLFSLRSGLTPFQAIIDLRIPGEQKNALLLHFELISELVASGVRLEQALRQVGETFPDEGVGSFVKGLMIALSLALEKGTNLCFIIEDIQNNYHSFLYLNQKIRVQSASAKLQSKIMGTAPIVLLVLVGLIAPHKIAFLFSPKGFLVLFGIIFLNLLGVLWMRIMMRGLYV